MDGIEEGDALRNSITPHSSDHCSFELVLSQVFAETLCVLCLDFSSSGDTSAPCWPRLSEPSRAEFREEKEHICLWRLPILLHRRLQLSCFLAFSSFSLVTRRNLDLLLRQGTCGSDSIQREGKRKGGVELTLFSASPAASLSADTDSPTLELEF